MWLLGSSLFSAQLAAQRGLPFAFASHFAPRMVLQAIDIYRRTFQPSAQLAEPYVAIGVPLVAAPTDEEADYLASSTYQRVLGILTGKRGQLPPPKPDFLASLDPSAQAGIADFLAAAVIGSPDTVRAGLTIPVKPHVGLSSLSRRRPRMPRFARPRRQPISPSRRSTSKCSGGRKRRETVRSPSSVLRQSPGQGQCVAGARTGRQRPEKLYLRPALAAVR